MRTAGIVAAIALVGTWAFLALEMKAEAVWSSIVLAVCLLLREWWRREDGR